MVDTSVIVAWIDTSHEHHRACLRAVMDWVARDELAVSSVTFAELAAGGRTREAVEEDLKDFVRIELDFASIGCRHLTNDRRRLAPWPDVDFVFPRVILQML